MITASHNRALVAAVQTLELRRLLSITVVNANSGNTGPGNDSAFGYEVSNDGVYATFISRATNIVSSPSTNNWEQAYRRNLATGKTEMVSVNAAKSSGATNDVLRVRSSADGRYVAFSTSATNITSGDNNAEQDTYFRDMKTGKTTLVSRGLVGVLADGIKGAVGGELVAMSPDGKYVVFGGTLSPDVFVHGATDNNSAGDLFLWNRDTQVVKCITFRNGTTTTGNGNADGNAQQGVTKFSADSRFLVFYSNATNYVSGVTDGNSSGYDVFLYDTATSKIEYVSTNAAGTTSGNADSEFADISEDGRYVAFETTSSNLVSGDNNTVADVLIKDRSNGSLKIASRTTGGGVSNGESTDPDITDDGRYVVYTSSATNIASPDNGPGTQTQVYRFDATTNTNVLVSVNTAGNGPGDNPSDIAAISNDGNYVAFESVATNLASNATKSDGSFDQIFLRNMTSGITTLVSVGSSNQTEEQDSLLPIFSQDGSRLLFKSSVDDLVSHDTNTTEDIFTETVAGNDFATLVSGALNVRGSALGDTISLAVKSGKINVTRNGATLSFTQSAVTSIKVDGSDGNDVITIGSGLGKTYAIGGSGDDSITGGDGKDNLVGAAGNDTLGGGAGDDRLDGGKGSDSLKGGDGDDRLYGGDSNDKLFGEAGADHLSGDAGSDTMDGGSSNDKFYANDGTADMIFGGAGRDSAVVDASKDILNAVESHTNG